jgi:hypothetical protein
MYFDDDFSAQVFQAEPYASDTGRDTFNDNDSIFAASNLMTLSQEGDVYLGLLNIDVDQA